MFAIVWRALRDRKWSILGFSLVGLFFAWVYVATYPSVQATQASISDLVKSFPPGLNKAFGLDPDTFGTFGGFVAGKQFSLFWPILLTSLLSGLSANFVAAEIEKGTIELTLAQPISRMSIFWAKTMAGILAIIFYVLFSVISYIPIAALADIPYSAASFILLSVVGFMLGLAIFGMGMLFSSLSSDRSRTLFFTIGIFISMYIVYLVALLDSKFENLKYVSFFYYYDYNQILTQTKVVSAAWPVLIGTFLTFVAAGLIWFNKRDIVT